MVRVRVTGLSGISIFLTAAAVIAGVGRLVTTRAKIAEEDDGLAHYRNDEATIKGLCRTRAKSAA
jgi:hypothetical protein